MQRERGQRQGASLPLSASPLPWDHFSITKKESSIPVLKVTSLTEYKR